MIKDASSGYTCPMHPEVVSYASGNCPKCGMALERAAPAAEKTIYTCPMHPEIGMTLEPKAIGVEDEERGALRQIH